MPWLDVAGASVSSQGRGPYFQAMINRERLLVGNGSNEVTAVAAAALSQPPIKCNP